jgi:hypothetical protein
MIRLLEQNVLPLRRRGVTEPHDFIDRKIYIDDTGKLYMTAIVRSTGKTLKEMKHIERAPFDSIHSSDKYNPFVDCLCNHPHNVKLRGCRRTK